MEYEFRYSLGRPEARTDGSGMVAHDLQAQASVAGEDAWVMLRHKTVVIPGAELSEALASGTPAAKGAAYKQLLAANINTLPEPVTGWGTTQLQLLLDGNEAATAATAASIDYVENVLGRTFPITFVM